MKNFSTHFWTLFTGDDFKQRAAFVEAKDDGLEETTYWVWTRRVQRLAVGLLEEGFEPGMRLGIVARNSREWSDLVFAAWMAGGCVAPLVPGRSRRETLKCLARAGADWIAVDDSAALLELRGQGEQLPDHLRWVTLAPQKTDHREGVLDLDALEEVGRFRAKRGALKELGKITFEIDPKSPALILFDGEPGDDPHGAFFSSGKLAIMMTYLGGELFEDDAEETVAVLMSNGWLYGSLVSLATLMRGQTLATSAGLRELADSIDAVRPTTLLCGPAFVEGHAQRWRKRIEDAPNFLTEPGASFGFKNALAKLGERTAKRVLYDPVISDMGGRLERLFVARGRAPDEVLDILENAGIPTLGIWGLPEAGISHFERVGAQRRGSVGRPVEGYVCKVKGVKAGESGEILLRSDVLFNGYWDDKGSRSIVDGYLETGVRGHLESGFLFIES